MSKRRVPKIVRESDRFSEIFIQAQCASNCPANGCHFNRMCQPSAQMVAGPIQKDLRLVLHSAKRARMNNACAIPLKFRSERMAGLRILPAPRLARLLGEWPKNGAFTGLHFFPRFAKGCKVTRLRFT